MSNPIERILNCLDGEQKYDEPPTKPEGYESMITEAEFEAIKNLKDAMENYLSVHNKNVTESIETIMEADEYAHIQLILLGDVVDEAMKAIGMMYGIHTVDKEFIETLAENGGYTIEGLRRHLEEKAFMEKLERIFG